MISRCRTGFVAAAGMSFAINLLVLTVSIYMLQVYDRVLSSRSLPTLVVLTLIAVGALLALGVFELLRSRILVRLATWLDRALSPAVFSRAVENAARGIQYRTEALRDLAMLRNFLGNGVIALFDMPWMPLFLAFIYLLHPVLGHVALAGAVTLLGLAMVTHWATHGILKRANEVAGRNLRSAESALRNAEVIDGMGMAGALTRRWHVENGEVLDLQALASDRAGWVAATAKFLRLFLQVAILGTGAYLVLGNQITAGAMIAASIVMSRALAPVEQAIGTWKAVLAAREAWGRLSEAFAQPPLRAAAMPLPKPEGVVTVENVTYTPAGAQQPVIRGVTLQLGAGEALAVIGPSAAGKSTLARLMVGIHKPDSGAVRLDGADVFSCDREWFGRHVGYLPQDVELFPGTVRENIARMSEIADTEAVIEAAKLAGVHEMVLRLPKGYDTEIGEQGARLSGGQRQRLGLARALFGAPSLLVLDEPNASLDAAGEQALNEAIKAMKNAGTTIVIVAHRPSLMAYVDKVLVMNEGSAQLFGARDAVFSELQRGNLQGGERRQALAGQS